jgi:hypothetical protein
VEWFDFAIYGFLATITVTVLQAALPAPAMASYGWRIPFLLAAPLGLIAGSHETSNSTGTGLFRARD